jgi:hypothetical protein
MNTPYTPHYPPHREQWPPKARATGWTEEGWMEDYRSLNTGYRYASPLACYNAAIHALRTILVSPNIFPADDARCAAQGAFWTDHLIAAIQGRTGVIVKQKFRHESKHGYGAESLPKLFVLFPTTIRHVKRDGPICLLDAYNGETQRWEIDLLLTPFCRALPLAVPADGRVHRTADRLTDERAARAYAALSGGTDERY